MVDYLIGGWLTEEPKPLHLNKGVNEMGKTIMTIKVEQKTIMPKYNPHQTGCGVHTSDKYKGRKSKVGQKIKNNLKKYY